MKKYPYDLNKVPRNCQKYVNHPEFARYYQDLITNGDKKDLSYNGYECHISRKSAGYLSGCVYFEEDDKVIDIKVHGGITCMGPRLIRFECNYENDFVPAGMTNFEDITYKNFDFVEAELKSVVDQLIAKKEKYSS